MFKQFQSTHLREVRPTSWRLTRSATCFNPRTYERCDFAIIPRGQEQDCFNPRTYKRCDIDIQVQSHLPCGFNPRTCERCDLMRLSLTARGMEFQSTHLREVRRSVNAPSCVRLSFNPRTCERCDPPAGRSEAGFSVSIHAPARGATVLSLR